MKKKKIFALCLGIFLAFSATLTACKSKNNGNEGGNKVGATVFYMHETEELALYDEIELVLLETVSGEVEWISSDESILKVESGKISTYKEGSATVTAQFDGKKQTQTFQVVKGENDLVLDFFDLPLILGTEYDLNANLLFKGSLVDNATFTYQSADESVVKIENGKAKALKVGTAALTVKASWRGVSSVVEKTVNCTVQPNAGIVTDKHQYDLYVLDEVRGQKFATECTIIAKTYEHGVEIIGSDISWSVADENIATVSAEGKITAVATGKTTVMGIWNSAEYGELKTVNIPVEVKIPILQTQDDVVIDLNKLYSPVDATALLGDGMYISIVENAQTGKTVEVVENGIKTDGLSVGEYRYVLYNGAKTYGVEVNLIVADYVVYDKEDFLALPAHYDAAYVALTKDVKNVGLYTNENYREGTQVFKGVFNGLGHIVSGMKIDSTSTGIFSHVSGATFKNVGFFNVSLNKTQSGVLFYRTDGATVVDNVHIQVSSMNSGYASGIICARLMSGKLKLSNVIVEANCSISVNSGALIGISNAILTAANVYVVVPTGTELCGTVGHSHNRKFNEINAMSLIYNDKSELVSDIFSGALTLEEGFNDYWDKSNGLPTLF